MASDSQVALLQAWASDIGHVVNPTNSAKAEFARLAKAKGWVGGDAAWCSRWKECFLEAYPYGQHDRPATAKNTTTSEEGGISLSDQMRRLSIGSDASSFSIVSRPSRANSFDSLRSFDSVRSFDSQLSYDSKNNAQLAPRSAASADSQDSAVQHKPAPEPESAECKEMTQMVKKLSLNRSEKKKGGNPAWGQFAGFKHSPTAPFKSEFERLAQFKGWGDNEKQRQFISLLSSEVAFYWDADEKKIYQYQDLCQDLDLGPMPNTVTQYRKTFKALRINIYSVLDHKRNPKIPIVQYKSLSKLKKSIRKSGTFPRDAAKAGSGCLSAFLSKL